MSTRCRIAIEREGGYESIYSHSGGYPTGVGAILKHHYTTEEKVNELIALADISSLGDTVAEEDTVSYNRWRNEGTTSQTHTSLKELQKYTEDSWGDYLYVFSNGKWNAYQPDYDKESSWKVCKEFEKV